MTTLVYALDRDQRALVSVLASLQADGEAARGRNASCWYGEVEPCRRVYWLPGCEAVAEAYTAAGVDTVQAILGSGVPSEPATTPATTGDDAPGAPGLDPNAGGESKATESPADASRGDAAAPPALSFSELRQKAKAAGINTWKMSADDIRAALAARG